MSHRDTVTDTDTRLQTEHNGSRRGPLGSSSQGVGLSLEPDDVVDVHGTAEGDRDVFVEGRH